ncbi:DNA-binding transcriptional regulator, LysR family [Collimonas sp. OK607]|uniref:LysR substrate-binding domain-containing protein n=1 Tax=Collimonas sp. OK607 TaxID=1798194 RepID=UPI0008F02880|nr:LysR substrate-binding domain-containing protein [Collimonas sp. OK607]SFB10594.1 DNA-binding transcriptional regulator, LysR family [Collimonas sp. OK607]
MAPINDLNNLVFFAKVVDAGSYTAAAEALGMQTSKLSRRISTLEAELGVRLLNRTTRKLSLTEIGKTFYGHCVALIAEAQSAKDAVHQTLSSPQGLIRMSCPVGLLQGGLADILARFLAAEPQVRIALDVTNRRVDVVDEGVDLAIRVRVPPLEDSDLAMRAFGPSKFILVASPRFVLRHGMPAQLANVAKMPVVAMGYAGDKITWRFQDKDGNAEELVHTPRLHTDDLLTLRTAALQSIGVAYMPALAVAEEMVAGTLVRLLPQLSARAGIIHAVFPSRRGMIPAVRALLDFLAVALAESSWQSSAQEGEEK